MKTHYTTIVALHLALLSIFQAGAQLTGSWQLWASGLQPGTYPKLNIAPNHDIYFGLQVTKIVTTTSAAMVDLTGKQVAQCQLALGKNTLDLHDFETGIYVLQTTVGTVKFIVQK